MIWGYPRPQKFFLVLVAVHRFEMLPEIVGTWPDLIGLCATFRKALIVLAVSVVGLVDRFEVSVQVVGRGEALCRSLASKILASEFFLVLGFMFTRWSQRIEW